MRARRRRWTRLSIRGWKPLWQPPTSWQGPSTRPREEVGRTSGPGDLVRIGRAYYETGDWPTARSYFDKVLDRAPEDEDWLAEIGAYYNLEGDREKAEELFGRSFAISPRAVWNLLKAAGSYEGVQVKK